MPICRKFPLGAASPVHSAVVHAAISVAPTEIRLTGSTWSISARELRFVALALAVLGSVYFWAAQYWIDPFEEGYFAYLASRVAVGDHPYRDFATPYTPAFFYLHALIFKLTGYNLVWQRVSVSVARVVGAGLLYFLGRRLAPARYAVLAPLTFLLLDPAPVPWQTHPSWYAASSATAAALAMLRYIDTRRWIWLAVAGLCAAVAFAFKQNTGLLTLLALLSFAVLTCPIPAALPDWSSRSICKFDSAFPDWIRRLPALAAIFLLPMALAVTLR
ncbi:MAG TPA: glycosyltransferase family 39 protein, partial [Chloroflexota bacterium]|nr:glycosyltransferase family 39 protein [Chloroflexota bacterium]